ncbi:MAG: hypothetical protein A2V88_17685 [Elusimicrobia bacterium RBG_16_66_12]|nr:MAG: hypothetical protein A2V88_17685 [Elusimicrobia bacterium RBG_16_66_12]
MSGVGLRYDTAFSATPTVVVVDSAGGGEYGTIASALAAITDASYSKPYTVLVMPSSAASAEAYTAKKYVTVKYVVDSAGRSQYSYFREGAELATPYWRTIYAPSAIAIVIDDLEGYVWARTAHADFGGLTPLEYAARRGIPLSFALPISGFVTGTSPRTGNALAGAFRTYGAEIANHGYVEANPSSLADAVEKVRAGKVEIEGLALETAIGSSLENGILCRTFCRSGTWAFTGADISTLSSIRGSVMDAIRRLHDCSTIVGATNDSNGQGVPSTMFQRGRRHLCPRVSVTAAEFATVASLQKLMDTLALPGTISICYHHYPTNGGPANAIWTGWMDYLETLIAAGKIMAVTVSTACLGELAPASTIDWTYSMVRDGGFELGNAAGNEVYYHGLQGANNLKDTFKPWQFEYLAGIRTATKAVGGSGYVALDTVTVNGGTAGSLAAIRIDTVDGGGAVLTFTVTAAGRNYALASAVATTTTVGVGAGFTVNITALEFPVISSGTPDSGTWHCQITADSSGNGKVNTRVPVEGGRSYLVRFRAKATAGTPVLTLTRDYVRIENSYDASNPTDTSAYTIPIDDTYRTYYQVIGAPATLQGKVIIRFTVSASATVYIDNVSVVPV